MTSQEPRMGSGGRMRVYDEPVDEVDMSGARRKASRQRPFAQVAHSRLRIAQVPLRRVRHRRSLVSLPRLPVRIMPFLGLVVIPRFFTDCKCNFQTVRSSGSNYPKYSPIPFHHLLHHSIPGVLFFDKRAPARTHLVALGI